MRQFPQEAKALIDEIVREIRNVRDHREDLVSIERAFSFKNRLLSLQNEASNLSRGCEPFLQTFLGALEEEINKLFEKIHSSSEPAPVAQPAPAQSLILNAGETAENNVIQLYPQTPVQLQPQRAVQQGIPAPLSQPEKTDMIVPTNPTVSSSPAIESLPGLKPNCLATLGLIADYLDTLIAQKQPIEAARLINLNQEIKRVRLILVDAEQPAQG